MLLLVVQAIPVRIVAHYFDLHPILHHLPRGKIIEKKECLELKRITSINFFYFLRIKTYKTLRICISASTDETELPPIRTHRRRPNEPRDRLQFIPSASSTFFPKSTISISSSLSFSSK